jgi:His-Xaa-Ser system protein HxsD
MAALLQTMNGISITAEGHSLSLDPSVYSIEAIKKAAYKFADRTSVIIHIDGNSSIRVVFNFVGRNAKNDPGEVISDFCNELLDQDLREIVRKESGPLRNVIIAHAFSRTTLTDEG